MDKYNLLLIDDDVLVHETAKTEFSGTGIKVINAYSGKEGLQLYQANPVKYPIVLLDYSMPDILGDQVLQEILSINSKQYVVMYSADQTRSTLKKTLLAGAVDFIEKDLDFEVKIERLNELYLKWKSLYGAYQPKKTLDQKREYINRFSLEGQSSQLYKICEQVEVMANKDSTVLIKGPSGTGKSDLAKAIVKFSKRKEYPVKTVNCGAISEKLFESEFFGHKKGAFTGAEKDKIGLLESCNHGTIFLDEIGDMPLPMQVKLLRAIQDQVITPVGSNKELKINVRIIAATNKDLEKEIKEKRFREDLYYRINVIQFEMPSLAERRDDIPLLVERFLKIFSKEEDIKISLQAIEQLQKYCWPGNIRELKNEIEKIISLTNKNLITIEDLSAKIFNRPAATTQSSFSVNSIEEVKVKQHEIEKGFYEQEVEKLHKQGLSSTEVVETMTKDLKKSKAGIYRILSKFGISMNNYKGVENVLQ